MFSFEALVGYGIGVVVGAASWYIGTRLREAKEKARMKERKPTVANPCKNRSCKDNELGWCVSENYPCCNRL